ncbi:DExH-box splicing factor binding site-domain-containing protein [Crassisporium funariophilum]|nr:DExH-box splicing factor binding site-domain-containing protein [Crassisporium funariophilum]
MDSKVSFTIRRPTPVSRAVSSGPDSDAGSSFKVPQLPRHISTNDDPSLGSPLARSTTSSPHPSRSAAVREEPVNDSSDEDNVIEDELVTGFDKFGVQRLNGAKKEKVALVIPALKNKDWRELARKRRNGGQYIPPSASAATGKDGSVGGLGTKDSINSGPVLSGLQVKKKAASMMDEEITVEESEDVKMEIVVEETEDQRALRAILAETNGGEGHEGPIIDIIPTPMSETDAYKQDVEELPDVATLDDYARVPVSQFGAALLRGMGWKEGTAASRKPGKGLIEPYLPSSRPALLGIGAKEQEVYDDGSKQKANKNKRPERRYVPIVKQERSDTPGSNGTRDRRERSRSPRRSSTTAVSSRRSSRSPDRYNGRSERRGDSSRRPPAYDDGRDRNRDTRRGDDRDSRRDDGRDRSETKRARSRESTRNRGN